MRRVGYYFKDYGAGHLDFVVPALMLCEVANAMMVACRQRRVSFSEAQAIVRNVVELGVPSRDCAELRQDAMRLGRIYSISVYDAVYLALAKREDVPLVTADKRSYAVARAALEPATRLGDYP
jgi:predicted nucleic acid-binding protein